MLAHDGANILEIAHRRGMRLEVRVLAGDGRRSPTGHERSGHTHRENQQDADPAARRTPKITGAQLLHGRET